MTWDIKFDFETKFKEGEIRKMMHEAIFAGFGGQGVLLIGQLLSYAAMKEGKNVTWMPSYGPEIRGGTANCSVVISDEEIASPIVDNPNLVISMNLPSLEKFVPRMRKGGTLIINTSLVDKDLKKYPEGADVFKIAATDKATELGNKMAANMVALGALIGRNEIINLKTLKDSLKDVLKGKGEAIIKLDKKALQLGYDLAKEKA